jgi:MFS family permease
MSDEKASRGRRMLFQFCLYGFLKNQQYFEPFFLLVLLEKTRAVDPVLALTWVGLLYGFRDICVNLLEVPSGAVADVLGRRRCMIVSFAAYSASFAVFGLGEGIWPLFPAMFLFAVGNAFRTGTHKAMIFEWLQREGRSDEKTAIYGLTRSWSKFGSAVSALVAAGLVFATGRYSVVFLVCLVPYLGNIVNFLFYPSYLDGRVGHRGIGHVARTLWDSLRDCLRRGPLRRLLAESMGFEGAFRVSRDYLQLIVQAAAVAFLLPRLGDWLARHRPGDDPEKLATTLLIGPVYFVLFLLAGYASRRSKDLTARLGDEDAAARALWWANLATFALLGVGVATGRFGVAILAIVVLTVLENFWRPVLIARVADRAEPARQATILSVESQSKALFAAIVAPLLGLSIDLLRLATDGERYKFLPLAALGVAISGGMLLTGKRRSG